MTSMWLACRFAFVQRFLPRSCLMVMFSLVVCEREGIVGGDEGPVGGVAQVVSHGVKVVGVHGEEGQEKDEEVREQLHGWYVDLKRRLDVWVK